jgi:PAS domain S-box-containing protein
MPYTGQPIHLTNDGISYSDHDSFFQNAPIGAFRTTPQGTYVFANPALARMYGYESPRHLMDDVTDIGAQLYVDPRDREEFMRLLESQGQVVNYECRQFRRDGSIFWSSRNAWVVYDHDSNTYYQGFTTDITERKQTEAAFRESEERFRRIIEDISNIAVQGYDEQRRVAYWNKASENLYGYSKEEAMGKKIEDLIIPFKMKDEVKRLHQRWIDFGEKIPAEELDLVDKYGNKVPVFSSHTMHETINGKEMFCLDVDLRPIRKAEKVAAEHEKYALVGQIAGKIAHDFNNILAGISGNTELALLDCKEADTRESLELILELADRGKNLTKNLVAFAKDKEPKHEYFQIKEKVDLVLSLLRKDLEGIRISRDDPEVPDILADPGMTEHALVNLIQKCHSCHKHDRSPSHCSSYILYGSYYIL